MKFLICIDNKNEIKKATAFDGYIIGINNLSIDFINTFSIEEVNEIIKITKEYQKELFIKLDDLYTDSDFIVIEKLINNINLNNIKGFIVSDIGCLQFLISKKLNNKIVYDNDILNINSFDFNFYKKDKIIGCVLPKINDYDLVSKIIIKSKYVSFLYGYGYYKIFKSRRNLLNSYNEQYNLNLRINNNENYYLIEEKRPGIKYPIIESCRGSQIYSNDIINFNNSINELKKMKLDYYIFNQIFIGVEDCIKVLKEVKGDLN